ncbi:hypothetical protein L209DRAFT_372512 [Thermothelomyces heterothallicus CBS 203.75]
MPRMPRMPRIARFALCRRDSSPVTLFGEDDLAHNQRRFGNSAFPRIRCGRVQLNCRLRQVARKQRSWGCGGRSSCGCVPLSVLQLRRAPGCPFLVRSLALLASGSVLALARRIEQRSSSVALQGGSFRVSTDAH